jgi:hypothetical protein
MAEADFGPSELDLIEDALEELELDSGLDRFAVDDVDPRVHARLTDYRSILVAAREALPLEDVPAGVLDDVLAQAHQAAAVPAAAAAAVHESWWTRARRSFMVPALALAGTAALVLWVFDPDDPSKLTGPPAAQPSAAAEKAPSTAARVAEGGEGEPTQATPAAPTVTVMPAVDAAAADAKDAEASELLEQGVTPEAEAKRDEEPAEPAKPAEARGMTSLGDVPGAAGGVAGGVLPSEPKAQKKTGSSAGPASGRWDIVSRGDRARQAGDCVAAREEYALALEDDEARVRARAFAGLGLCDAAAGDEPSADANYEKARSLDEEVGTFIESQNERTRGSGKKSRKPAKKSKVDTVDAFDDPMQGL